MSRRRRRRIKKLPAAQIAARNAIRLQRLNEVKINHGGYSPQTTALMRHESIGYGKKWPNFPELYQLTEKHVSELLFMTLDPDIEDEYPSAHTHAWRALGQLRAENAVPILLDQFADESSIYLDDVIVRVFAIIGSSAIPHLERIFDEYLGDEYPAILAVRCLEEIGSADSEARETCNSVLATLLGQYDEYDDEFNGCVAAAMLTLKATGYQYLIEEAFKDGALSDFYVNWESLDRVFNPRAYYRENWRIALTGYRDHPTPTTYPPVLKPCTQKSLPVEDPVLIPLELPFREIVPKEPDQNAEQRVSGYLKIKPAVHSHHYNPPLDQLLWLGQTQPGWLSYAELGIGSQHIPELLRMATDKQLGAEYGDTLEFWGTAHARRALAQLGATTVVEPFIQLFREWRDDVVSEDLPIVLAKIGPPAIDALKDYLAEESAEKEWQGSHASESLEFIARKHPESRERCVSILVKQLEHFAKQDSLTNAFLIYSLIRLQAVEAANIIEQVLTSIHEYEIEADLTGDWFHAQYQLGLINAKEADRQRNDYWRKRNQKTFGWPGRGFNEYYTWLDDGHDFTSEGFIDRAYLKTRAARWAYRLSQGWYYGPYAVVSIARTDTSKEAQIVGIAVSAQ